MSSCPLPFLSFILSAFARRLSFALTLLTRSLPRAMPRRIDRARRRQWHHREPSRIKTAQSSEHSDGGADMLTMALLAIVAAFIFGFVLCGMFAVGAAADLD